MKFDNYVLEAFKLVYGADALREVVGKNPNDDWLEYCKQEKELADWIEENMKEKK